MATRDELHKLFVSVGERDQMRRRSAGLLIQREYLALRHIYWIICRSARRYQMKTSTPDLPQGTLDMLILKVVAAGPIHGYAIAQRIQQISSDVLQVRQGSLYPALHRLEKRKLLEAEWKASETGREAKFYRLTRKGRTHLA